MSIHKFWQGLLAIVLLGSSSFARADLITFTLDTNLPSPSADGFFTGYITFDSSDVFAGNTVNAASFVDWAFTFGSDMSIAAGGGSNFVSGLDSITFDAMAGITSWSICVTTPGTGCSIAEIPGFYSDGFGNLNYTLAGGSSFNTSVEQSWSGVTAVPSPEALLLIGIGLLAFGLRRRQ